MAEETVAYLEDVVGGPAHLVGYSDGGNAAMLLAIARPDLVQRLVLIGSNLHHEGALVNDPIMATFGTADDPNDAYLASAYGAVSPDGPDHWPIVRNKTVAMFRREPTLMVSDLG
jgi:pimeloyl-ACP methyl ester carboxylesterase